jgi:tetratricopeptide (TPR) repeat protein
LRNQLARELEWIPLKAMRKERPVRYATAAEFAHDIENYLHDRPLVAGPESPRYRLRKFARRNAAAIAVAAAFIVMVGGGTATYVRGVRAEQRKTLAALDDARRQRELAERRAAETTEVANFQGRMLTNINLGLMASRLREDVVNEARQGWQRAGLTPGDVDARRAQLELLLADANFTNPALQSLNRNVFRGALVAIDKEFADQPLVKARLLQHVATTLRQLTLIDAAMPPQAEALAIRRRHLRNEHEDTLQSIHEMTWLLISKGDYENAEHLAREMLATRRHLIGGGDDRLTLRYLRALAEALQRQGRLDEAEQYHRESVNGARHLLPVKDRERLDAILRLGQVLLWQRKLSEAEPLLVEAHQRMSDALGENHRDTVQALVILGSLRNLQGDLAEAEAAYRAGLKSNRGGAGDDHRESLWISVQLAAVLRKQGHFEEAESLLTNAVNGFERVLGPDHTDTLMAREGMAMLRQAQADFPEAESRFADLHERAARAGLPAATAARYRSGYGVCLAAMARYADAEAPLLESYSQLKATKQQRHEDMHNVVAGLAEVYQHTNRPEQAAQYRAELERLDAATQPARTATATTHSI